MVIVAGPCRCVDRAILALGGMEMGGFTLASVSLNEGMLLPFDVILLVLLLVHVVVVVALGEVLVSLEEVAADAAVEDVVVTGLQEEEVELEEGKDCGSITILVPSADAGVVDLLQGNTRRTSDGVDSQDEEEGCGEAARQARISSRRSSPLWNELPPSMNCPLLLLLLLFRNPFWETQPLATISMPLLFCWLLSSQLSSVSEDTSDSGSTESPRVA